jgi:hypothetical protein
MSNAEYLSRPFPLLAKLAAVLRTIAPVRRALVRLTTLLRGSKKSEAPLVTAFVGEIPDVAGKVPGIADKAPDATDEASAAITDDVPDVVDDARQVPGAPPEVADGGPEVVDEAPASNTGDVPDAAGDAIEVMDSSPGVADEIPGIADEAPAITDEAPDVGEASEPPVMVPAVSAEVPVAPVCTLSAREQLIRRRWAETGIKMWAGLGALNIQGSAQLLPLQPGATRREYDRLEFRLIAGDIVCEGVVVDPPGPRK